MRIQSLARTGLLLALCLATAAGAEAPELLDGTDTIYQRVLTKPGQSLHFEPDGPVLGELAPLQPVYVFETQGGWLRIGRSVEGSDGWIDGTDTLPWVHNIVGAFTLRGDNRERQLLFGTRDELNALLSEEAFLDLAAKYRLDTENEQTPADSGVVMIEPEQYADVSEQKSFYLMPITAFEESRFGPRRWATLHVEVAAAPLNQQSSTSEPPEFRTGIVFVIDTTSSMKPFIDETLNVVRDTVEELRAKGRSETISFGLIGYRDNPEGRPGTEYRVKEFQPLTADAPPEAIVEALGRMEAMKSGSTWGFEEDAIAGLAHALETTKWKQGDVDFAGRFIILITDAPPKPLDDPNAETQRSPQDIFRLAAEQKVGISTIHLITKTGRLYTEVAEEAYRTLSRFKSLPDSMYRPVDASDPAVFRERLRTAMGTTVGAITEETDLIDYEVAPEIDMKSIGKAMRLAYLGRLSGQDVPPILQGWTLDRSFEAPNEFALEPRVLITRNQLLGMTENMRAIVDEVNDATRQGREDLLFENIRDVVIGIGGDGNRLVKEGAENLGGMIAEFLEYMPYYSMRRLVQITDDEWNSDPGLRFNVALELEGKLDTYETLYTSERYWTELYEGQPEGERVYAMPLEALP